MVAEVVVEALRRGMAVGTAGKVVAVAVAYSHMADKTAGGIDLVVEACPGKQHNAALDACCLNQLCYRLTLQTH